MRNRNLLSCVLCLVIGALLIDLTCLHTLGVVLGLFGIFGLVINFIFHYE